jgi:hypothetical protein
MTLPLALYVRLLGDDVLIGLKLAGSNHTVTSMVLRQFQRSQASTCAAEFG